MKAQHKAAFPGWDTLLSSEVLIPEFREFLTKHPEQRHTACGWVTVSRMYRSGDFRRAEEELYLFLEGEIPDELYRELLNSVSHYVRDDR